MCQGDVVMMGKSCPWFLSLGRRVKKVGKRLCFASLLSTYCVTLRSLVLSELSPFEFRPGMKVKANLIFT